MIANRLNCPRNCRYDFAFDALIGHPLTPQSATHAAKEMARDFQPLTDMRASAAYRLTTAQNLLIRYAHDLAGTPTNVLKVTP